MNTFLQVAIAMVGMTGLAAAQPKADPKVAAADPKMADPKAGGMGDMKGPPPELAEMAKATSGTWTCKGQGMDHTGKMNDMTATMKMKLELDGWWMHSSFESKMGKDAFRFESFTTFDPASKKWKRVMVETDGGWASGESAGMKDKKVDWDLATHSVMMGDGMFRDHEDMSDPKAGAHMSGEMMDKSKNWVTVYDVKCKK